MNLFEVLIDALISYGDGSYSQFSRILNKCIDCCGFEINDEQRKDLRRIITAVPLTFKARTS